MNKVDGIVMIICFILFLLLVGIMLITNGIKKEEVFYYEEYVACKNDTFWAIYEDKYQNIMSYDEALYLFKKDNNMKAYELIEGKTYLVRNYN